MTAAVPLLLSAIALIPVVPAAGQEFLERTPNLSGTYVTPEKTARFVFLHRFERVGEDEKKVLNYPTFLLGAGLPNEFDVGATYVSNSEIGAGTPNEWELWVRKRFRFHDRLHVTGTGAWNTAAESVDGEVAAKLEVGRLAALGALRGFSSAFGEDDSDAALAAGALFRITPLLAVGGDVARVVTTDDHPTAWSAGVHMVIPGSPHMLGFVVSNVGATTLQSASRGIEELDGDDAVRLGFSFTVPMGTFGQWARIFHGAPEPHDEPVVTIQDFKFGLDEIRIKAGETVRWVNEDPVPHTVTADDESFDSGLIAPGEGYSRRFDTPGEFPYHCTPHPFMVARVIVEPA